MIHDSDSATVESQWTRFDWLAVGLLVLIAAVVVNGWFTPGLFLAGGDNFVALRPIATLPHLLTTWNDAAQAGGGGYLMAVLPLHLVWLIGDLLHLGTAQIQPVIFWLLFAGMGSGAYCLARQFWPRAWRLAALVAALFYLSNMTVMFNALFTTQLWTFALAPFLLVAADRYLTAVVRDGQLISGRLATLVIVSLGLSIVATNPPGLAALLTMVLVVIGWRLWSDERWRSWRLLQAIGLAAVLITLINLWWIVPFLALIRAPAGIGGVAAEVKDPVAWAWTSARTSLVNILRFVTHIGWDDTNAFPQRPYYDRWWVRASLFVATLTTLAAPLAAVLASRRLHRFLVAVIVTTLGLMFLIKGLHDPFATVNYWLYQHVPGFWLFRDPGAKFFPLLTLCFVILITATLDGLYQHRRRNGFVALTGVTLALLIAHWPLLSGWFIALGNQPERPYRAAVQLPADWQQLSESLAAQPAPGAILLTPNNAFYQVGFDWGYYGVDVLGEQLLGQPVMKGAGTAVYLSDGLNVDTLTQAAFKAIEKKDAAIWPIADLLGIGAVLERRDLVVADPATALTADEVRSALEADPELDRTRSFGALTLYERSPSQVPPRIHAVTNPMLLGGSLGALAQVTSRRSTDQPFAIITPEQPTEEQREFVISHTLDQRVVVPAENFSYDEHGFTGVVEPPTAGQYAVFARIGQAQPGATLTVGGDVVTLPTKPGVDWQRVGVVELTASTTLNYSSDIVRPALENLVSNPTFADGPWEVIDAYAAAPGQPEFATRIVPVDDRANAIELTARHHLAGMRVVISQLRAGTRYQLTFRHRHLSGSEPGYAVEMLGDEPRTIIGRTPLAIADDWQRETVQFTATESSGYLYFYTEGFLGDASVNQFADVRVIELAPLGLDGLLFEREGISSTEAPAPAVTFNKHSPAHYSVTVAASANPNWLTFLQSYHPWWQLTDASTHRPAGTHVVMNGYANGWYLEPAANERYYELWYRPQRWFEDASLVSILTLVVVLASVVGRPDRTSGRGERRR